MSHQSKLKNVVSKFLKYGLPTLLSMGLCYVLFRDINLAEMYDFIVNNCDFSLILVTMALGVLSFWFRAMRWRMQLNAIGINPPATVMCYSIAGTYAVNLVLPRLGELWRCEYISRRQQAPFASVLGSMVSERLADTATVLLMLLATIIWAGSAIDSFVEEYPGMFDMMQKIFTSPLTYAIIIIGLAAIWLLYRHYRQRSWMMKIKAQIKGLLGGFTSVFRMRRAWLWLLLTVLLWGTYLVQMIISFEAFAPTREFMAVNGPLIALVSFVLASLSMAVPSNGGIGPYQVALGFGIMFFMKDSLTSSQCYAFATLVLGAQMIVTIVCGLISFVGIAIDNHRHSTLPKKYPPLKGTSRAMWLKRRQKGTK